MAEKSSNNIYSRLSVDNMDQMLAPYLRIFKHRGYIESSQVPRFLRLLDEKLNKNEIYEDNQLKLDLV